MSRILMPVSRRGFSAWLGAAAASLTCVCGRAAAQNTTPSDIQPGAIPGAEKSTKSEMLGIGADLLQGKSPIHAINMYLNGFHFYADDMGRQVEAHHFCAHVNEEFFQCVIYDGNTADSRLIGIEYIVSARIFNSLPAEEKPLWHSHRHETTSGELLMPGIPAPVVHTAIASLVSTYGKTWHTWQIDRDTSLPLGIPQLMMGFTADGQLKSEMIQKRDKELDMSTMDAKRRREDLAASAPQVLSGADAWQNGKSRQLALREVALKNRS
ncbi:OBAP family protein [Dongia soli]|uniref:OBAP family protein n=1 Tax=Dongia soli TaxID=600628 RepID=A0ABU5EHE3_9PROT|nr:OBAP family protein [Dongia soli]MDY0885656.1 OBAP family protein [Dongia soli]